MRYIVVKCWLPESMFNTCHSVASRDQNLHASIIFDDHINHFFGALFTQVSNCLLLFLQQLSVIHVFITGIIWIQQYSLRSTWFCLHSTTCRFTSARQICFISSFIYWCLICSLDWTKRIIYPSFRRGALPISSPIYHIHSYMIFKSLDIKILIFRQFQKGGVYLHVRTLSFKFLFWPFNLVMKFLNSFVHSDHLQSFLNEIKSEYVNSLKNASIH